MAKDSRVLDSHTIARTMLGKLLCVFELLWDLIKTDSDSVGRVGPEVPRSVLQSANRLPSHPDATGPSNGQLPGRGPGCGQSQPVGLRAPHPGGIRIKGGLSTV